MLRCLERVWPVILVVTVDQWSKHWAALRLRGSTARSLLEGLLELRYTTNRGALFGHGIGLQPQTLRLGLVVLGFFASLWLLRLLLAATPSPARAIWAYRLALAGVLGNTLDRVRNSEVTDFLHVRLGEAVELGTINLADIAVILGIALLIPELLARQTPQPLSSNANIPRR